VVTWDHTHFPPHSHSLLLTARTDPTPRRLTDRIVSTTHLHSNFNRRRHFYAAVVHPMGRFDIMFSMCPSVRACVLPVGPAGRRLSPTGLKPTFRHFTARPYSALAVPLWLPVRAFQFGQKKFRFDSIRFDSSYRIDFFRFDSIRQSHKFAASTLIFK